MIFILTPILLRLWATQAARRTEPPPVAKMAFACLCVALANLVMAVAASNIGPGEKAAPWWLVGYFAVVTLGELFLAPVGLALIAAAAPIRMRAMMMGVWFATTLPGDILAGWLGGFWSTMGKVPFYVMIASIAALASGALWAASGMLRSVLTPKLD
jgi:POT family proton-dependent oligopeptide transporter